MHIAYANNNEPTHGSKNERMARPAVRLDEKVMIVVRFTYLKMLASNGFDTSRSVKSITVCAGEQQITLACGLNRILDITCSEYLGVSVYIRRYPHKNAPGLTTSFLY